MYLLGMGVKDFAGVGEITYGLIIDASIVKLFSISVSLNANFKLYTVVHSSKLLINDVKPHHSLTHLNYT